MAVRTITTRLALDGETQFKQAMTSINGALRNLKSELMLSEAQFRGQANTVEALTAKDKLLKQEIEQQREKVKALAQALVDANAAYGENSTVTDRYRQQLARAQADLINMNGALAENARYLQEALDSADGTAKSIDEFGLATRNGGNAVGALSAALQAAGVAATLKEIADSIYACVDASMEFETAMANFNKVAKLSDEELAVMADQIKELSTRIPATTTEIAQVAEASSRLGIAKEYVLEFSAVMVNLGNVSDLSAEQAATSLARFANIVGTSADDYERLGSTIVALGNNFATSESEITNMASRLAAAGKLARLSEADILGLAAAMSSVGIEAEAGGTAMTQTLTAMEKAVTSGGKKLDEFARIAGMSSAEFAAAWQQEPIKAIQAFIAGLGDLDSRGESATQVLDELGLSGIRQSNMLKSLALASETLSGTLTTAEQAWRENTELAETAAAKYDTTEAKMQLAANAANNLKVAVGDQLTPALGLLADVGTGAFSWAAAFVESNPMLISAITGLVAAAGVMAAGFTAYAAKAALATIATTAWGTALMNTPIGPIAIAIGVLVTAVTAYAAAADEANSRAKSLAESMQASAKAIEAQREATEEQRENVAFLAGQLDELAGKENKTTAEKEKLLAITQQLNEAVPGLDLSYDALNDTLSMTTEQILALARAQSDAEERANLASAIVDREREQAQAAKELEQAQIDLAAAIERRNKAIEDGTYAGLGAEHQMELDSQVLQLEKNISALEKALADSEAQVAEMTDRLEELGDSAQDSGDGMEKAAEAAEDTGESFAELEAQLNGLEEAQLYAAGAADALSAALAEQEKNGSLSVATARELIKAGYGAAIAIDEETGAVTVNAEEYRNLAEKKLGLTIAAAQVELWSEKNHLRMLTEKKSVDDLAASYNGLTVEKLAEQTAGNITALETQIAALNRAKGSLNSYSGASESAARRSSSASKKIKTQAEKDLEEYKTLKAALDHEKALELVSEEEYYRQLAEFRDQYLTDDANVSEYRKVTEQIFKYDKALADQEAELWDEQSEKLLDSLEDRAKSVSNDIDQMSGKLSGYGDLFTMEKIKGTDKEKMNLESLQTQIDAINKYENALIGLKERNISGSLMDEILGMDVDSATQYAKQLLSMSEEQWQQYNDLWDEKQQRAAEVAEQFFKDQLNAVETEYAEKLGSALDGMFDVSFSSGVDTVQGLIDGIDSMEGPLYEKMKNLNSIISSSVSDFWNIPSNSQLAASFSTERIAERYQGVTNQQLQNAVVGGVNGLSSSITELGAAASSGTGDVYLDSQKVGRILLPGLRLEAKANPEVKDDTK